MNRKALVAASTLLALVFLLSTSSCNRNRKLRKPDAAFAPYITAYTGGVVSTYSDIKIRFANEVADTSIDLEKEGIFSISPNVAGKLSWADAFTLQFKPDKPLKADELYDIDVKANKIIDLPKNLKTFSYSFKTIKQSIATTTEGVRVYDKNPAKYYRVFGKIMLADNVEIAALQKSMKADLNGKEYKVKLEAAGERMWTYTIDSVPRSANATKLNIRWDGDEIDADEQGSQTINIPALGKFGFIMSHTESNPDQYVSMYFSEALNEAQDLSGLVNLGNFSMVNSFIVDNELRVFPLSRQTGSQKVMVSASIQSTANQTLGQNSDIAAVFEEIKPTVRIKGKGVIIPNSNGLILPFEAVNLNAVDVEVFKIYENNIRQFFQVNDIDGNSELYRVGKKVVKKKIPLTGLRNTWTDYSLDLADLVKTEPGAIYRVKLTFKKGYSTYDCVDEGGDDKGMETMNEMDTPEGDEREEGDEYGYYNDYDYYYDDEYDYTQRDNPCNSAYYNNTEHYASRNVLASDLGLTAKAGPNGVYNVFVTHLITTKPMSGVVVEIYDFVNQRLGTATTDGQGMAKMSIPKKHPFLLIAKNGKQRGYLKLGENYSLTQSNFDVGGETVQKGIKGFIYGERGVWRPGDSLYVSFMLEDKNKVLPPKHPVTFELVNPRGQVVQKMLKTEAIGGIYNFSTSTDDNAPTGTYTARVKVGGATFTQGLKVETIMPNRLKINLDFGKPKLTPADVNLQAPLKVAWLNGANARGLRANVAVTLNKAEATFDKYKEYIFDDPTLQYYPESQTIFDGYLDDNGLATVQPAIKATNAPAVLTAGFTVRVFEEGGNFSIDRFSLPFYPYNSYVGLLTPKSEAYYGMLPNNKDHNIKVATISPDGKPVSGKKVRYEVYKLEWRWWFDESELGSFNYMNSNYKNLVDSATAYSTNGFVNFKLKVREPEWGRYLIRVKDVESGHTASQTVYIDYADSEARQGGQSPEAATMLAFSTDKQKYNVGDEVTVTIPSSPGGRALVSIENGSGVISSFWKELESGQTVVKFKVDAKMSPNVYINISLIQPHAQAINDLPIRLYGIQPILVENKETHLSPTITSAETFRPGETASITVKEKSGKPMTYTLAIVDEGLLDLTRFKTPDPWNTFYAREALGTRTWDVFDNVLGAYGAALGRILSIGGDGEMDMKEMGGKESVRAKRFKPMVVFVGPTTLGKGGSKTHTIKIPEYVGSARIMVVARNESAYGNAEKTVSIKKPLMVLATLPRVLGPNETVKLPVSVFAMEAKVKNVSVQLKADPAYFVVEGSTTQKLTFTKIGDQLASFNLKVKPNVGVAKVQVIATGGGETATSTIEIDVRNPNPPVTEVTEYMVEPGKSVSGTVKQAGMDKTNKMQLELSTLPPINLGKRLRYLITYPHGCIEQTTSAAFPQLALGKIMNLDANYAKSIQTNVKAALSRLRSFQTPSGGFAYWPGGTVPDEWGTTYAGHFLLEAEADGYQLPVGMLENWKRYQKKQSVQWMPGSPTDNYYMNHDLMQAYRLYTLALAKTPEVGAMNKLRETKGISIAAKWRLAAAYQISGNKGTASAIINGLTTTVPKYTEWGYTYGSSDRDLAMILETLTLMDRRTQAMPIAKQVSALLSNNGYWMSTQSTAYCLLAMGKYAGNTSGSPLLASYTVNGAAGRTVTGKKSLFLTDVAVTGTKANAFTIKNTGKGVLFVRVIAEGTPAQGAETKAESNLRMTVNYKTLGGRPITVDKIEQGTDFIAEVTLTHPGILSAYENMALTQIFPSGWEIHNSHMDDVQSAVQSSPADYDDIRDDRVYTYFSIGKNQTRTYKVILNAAYLGRYYLPLVYCEAMYDNSVSARVPGRWVEVVAPGTVSNAVAKK